MIFFTSERRAYIMVTPVIVANNFIKRALSEEIALSPLKLQKLVYFLYKDYLKETNTELFNERFETWKYGPVVPSLYSEFMSFGDSSINQYARDSQGKTFFVKEEGDFKKSITKVWKNYKAFSGSALSNLTHQEGTAWSLACDRKDKFLDTREIMDEREL